MGSAVTTIIDHLFEQLWHIPIDLFAGVIWAAPVWLVVRHLPARRRWRTTKYSLQPWRKPPPPRIVLSANQSSKDDNGHHVSRTGLGQVQALSLIAPSLAFAYKDSISHGAIQFATSVSPDSPLLEESDVILIGGPKTNEITRVVLESKELAVGFQTKPKPEAQGGSVDVISYKDPATGKIQELVTKGDDAYAIVIQFKNPLATSADRTMTLLAGSSTYGTELAAMAFAANSNLRKFVPYFKKRQGFVAVVSGKIAGDSSKDRWVKSQKVVFVDHFPFGGPK